MLNRPLDQARSEFITALSRHDIDRAKSQLAAFDVERVYKQMLRTRLQHDMILINTLRTRRLRRGLNRSYTRLQHIETDLASELDRSET